MRKTPRLLLVLGLVSFVLLGLLTGCPDGADEPKESVKAVSITTDPAEVGALANDVEVEVTLETETEEAKIYYTLDGTAPTAESELYETKFSVSATDENGETVTVKAIGIKEGLDNSTVAVKEITFKKLVLAWDGLTKTEPTKEGDVYIINNANELAWFSDKKVTDEKLRLENDINLNNKDGWIGVNADGYSVQGIPEFEIDGNNYTIFGLANPLVYNTWSGIKVTIKDLTIKDSKIEKDLEDSTSDVGVGAFIGYSDSHDISLTNCKLIDSEVKGGHWTGGLVGYLTGSAVDMGLMTANNCSVVNSTIEGKGSAGGFFGHATGSAHAEVTVTNAVVTDNVVKSTGSSDNKAGSLLGTVGAGTVNVTNLSESENTVTSNDKAITDRIYGRQGSPTGKLVVDEVEVDFS